jgi:hypothetical protein
MYLLMKKEENKLDNLMINLKQKIKLHSWNNWKYKKINKNNNNKKKRKNKLLKCIFLMDSVKILLKFKILLKYKKWLDYKNKYKNSHQKLNNLLKLCKKKSNNKINLNLLKLK